MGFSPGGFGGASGGGGGLHFRRPADVFADAAARTLLFGTTDLTAYQDFANDEFLAVIIGTLAVPTDFQTYTGDAGDAYDDTLWVSRADAVQGFPGDVGAQARFFVFGHINASVAPVAAPAGGTYTQSTGVTVLPAGYTAAAVTPAAGEKTYRTLAVVNPAVDDNVVNLAWAIPAELPAYLAAGLAETAQAAAEVAEAAAEVAEAAAKAAANTAVDIPTGSPRGALIGTSPTLSVASATNATVRAFGAAEVWTLGPNAPASFILALIANNERFLFPDLHPPGLNGVWYVVEVGGVEIDEVFMPWGGVSQSPANANSVQYLSAVASGAARNLTMRYFARSGDTPAYAAIYGAGTALPANTVVKIYTAVVRGEKGDAGTGPGAEGVTEGRVQEIINATSVSALQGMATDGQIPAAIMRDAEFTSAAVIALITGNIAFSDLDGMIADGQVPASFMRDAELTLAAVASVLGITAAEAGEILVGVPSLSGSDLTFTKADGTDSTITLPAGGGGTADGRLRFGATDPAADFGANNDSYVKVDTTAGTAEFFVKANDAWTSEFTVDLSDAGEDHTRLSAISADADLSTQEVTAGESSTTNIVTTPMWGVGVVRNLYIGVPEAEGDITDILFNGLSQFANYSRYQDAQNADIIVSGHKWWQTADLDGEYYSQVELEIVQ